MVDSFHSHLCFTPYELICGTVFVCFGVLLVVWSALCRFVLLIRSVSSLEPAALLLWSPSGSQLTWQVDLVAEVLPVLCERRLTRFTRCKGFVLFCFLVVVRFAFCFAWFGLVCGYRYMHVERRGLPCVLSIAIVG